MCECASVRVCAMCAMICLKWKLKKMSESNETNITPHVSCWIQRKCHYFGCIPYDDMTPSNDHSQWNYDDWICICWIRFWVKKQLINLIDCSTVASIEIQFFNGSVMLVTAMSFAWSTWQICRKTHVNHHEHWTRAIVNSTWSQIAHLKIVKKIPTKYIKTNPFVQFGSNSIHSIPIPIQTREICPVKCFSLSSLQND